MSSELVTSVLTCEYKLVSTVTTCVGDHLLSCVGLAEALVNVTCFGTMCTILLTSISVISD